jgi:hypothetical protein
MDATTWGPRQAAETEMTLRTEVRQSVLLLGLTALVSATALGTGLLVVQALG